MDAAGELLVTLEPHGLTADELAEHAKNLAGIDKESKGACIWLPKPVAETA